MGILARTDNFEIQAINRNHGFLFNVSVTCMSTYNTEGIYYYIIKLKKMDFELIQVEALAEHIYHLLTDWCKKDGLEIEITEVSVSEPGTSVSYIPDGSEVKEEDDTDYDKMP